MDKEKPTALKVRRDKKKNTETGLLMGQNTNIFSQLSATYLQSKSSATEEETNFVNSTQIVEYHDANINRLIALLRKKADVTKAKAAIELKEEIMKMNESNIEEFSQTFSHLFMETVIGEQSKQVIDEFISMISYLLANFKKIMIKEIGTIFGPLFVILRSNNVQQLKIYAQLFNGTDEQLHEKAVTLLINKNVMKKFLVFCRVIVECEETHKIGQPNFQRNCSSLLKIIKDLIRSYESIPQKKEETISAFSRFILEIEEIVSGKFVEEYFKVGGRAKSSFLELYQTLISTAVKHQEWKIDWEKYAKTLCQNYLDKDVVVQNSLWKYCNKSFIESTLELEKLENKDNEEVKQKGKYHIFTNYLPKPDEKLLSALKQGGQALYKELPDYCTIFPFTSLEEIETHKSAINKISFIRKLMQSLLESEDENEARMEAYYQLSKYFIGTLRKLNDCVSGLDEKKQLEIKSLGNKAEREIINSLQERFYQSPPVSRNSFTFNLPNYFCKLLEESEPNFDFVFNDKQTFQLYTPLKNGNNSHYCISIFDQIYENCKNDQQLLLRYLENFPKKSINLDMSETNLQVEEASKIFLLSKESEKAENWFGENWDIKKKLIVFDPRIIASEVSNIIEYEDSRQYHFKPANKNLFNDKFVLIHQDQLRYDYFIQCLEDEDMINVIPFMLSFVKEVLLERASESRDGFINKLLEIYKKKYFALEKKQWFVSQVEILRLRVIADIILDTLLNSEKYEHKFNEENTDHFLSNYCSFVLVIYNYKLEFEAEEMLKLIFRSTNVPKLEQKIFLSVRKTINEAYQIFSKIGAIGKEGEEKQRKNRLNRFLNFVEKMIWYGVNKKKEENYRILFEDVLSNPDWIYAEHRPDLWLWIGKIFETIDEKTKITLVKSTIASFDKQILFLTLLMCCQLILPLQRYPSTKKIVIELQTEFLRQLKESENEEMKLNLLNHIIKQSIENESSLLVYGAKNLVKSLLKNYHKLAPDALKLYEDECLSKLIEKLNSSSSTSEFNRKSLLLINIINELPLLDLQNIESTYSSLEKKAQEENNQEKILGYYAAISTMWESSIGIDKLTNEEITLMIGKIIAALKITVQDSKTENSNYGRFSGLTFLNSLIQVKGKEVLKEHWDFILNEIVWGPVVQGSLLHSALQSARFKFISKIFSSESKEIQSKIVQIVPEEITKEVNFYKEVLDQIEDEENESENSSGQGHYENIVNMFIEFAEVIVRITGGLNKDVKPKEELILDLLQCPFPGIKKTSFMLLKQMYELGLVNKIPPASFISYLTLDNNVTKDSLDPIVANQIASYLYSWQAIIQRRSAIERASEEESTINLEDYLQNEQLHESFLKNIFEILENLLEYSKNEEDYELEVQELIEMDTIVNIEDDSNLQNKIFRVTIRTLFMFVQNFPLFLKNFMDKNRKYKNICDRLLRSVISDAIFKEEVTKIEMTEHEWKASGNFEIYVTAKSKEIYAEYTHDVIRIGLRLSMKSNYPISPITIEFGEGLKIDEGSKWALMLQNQLHSRNNTIINGILLWKDNIDKKLAGVEECAICFDIVNGQGQLPKKGCKTCKKKFHSVCIMKWFNKSNKSECPLCKSQFL